MNDKNCISLFLTIYLLCCNLAFAGVPTCEASTPATTITTNHSQSLLTSLPIFSQGYSAAPGQEFCVEITTTDFDSIVSMQYTMNWDTAVLKFVSINLVDMPDQFNFGSGTTNACTQGILAISWNANQNIGFASVPDGTVLYELCFIAQGDVGTCTDLTFTGEPLNIEVITASSNGMNVGLDNTDGTICIIEPVALTNVALTHVNCSNVAQGAIDLEFEGGTAPYTYQWAGPNNFDESTEDLSNLEHGTYYLTLTDNSPTPLIILDTFEIVGDFSIGVANAGADTSLNCYNNALVELSGSSDPDDSDIVYEWYTNDGNIDSGTFTLNPAVNAPGTYYLVTYNTFSNCADTSAVFVANNMTPPFVDAGDNDELNCFQSMLNLDGTNSMQGNEMVYSWSTGVGNIVNGDSTLTPLIDAPGIYELQIFNTTTGCTGTASVIINQDSALPTAVTNEDTLLTCIVTQIVLDGTGSSFGDDFSYLWTTADGGPIENATTLNPTISQAGTYQLIVTDDLNMCSDTSIVIVSDEYIPPTPVSAGAPVWLTCANFANELDGTATVQGPEYNYLWTTLDGNILEGETTLTPAVDECGTYTLQVTNTLTGCSDFSEVLVNCDTVPPVIVMGEDQLLTCTITEVMLDASNSSSGPEFTYTWDTFSGNVVSGGNTLIATVDEAGLYGLLIQNMDNGCTTLENILVSLDTLAPVADAGTEMTIECGDPLFLNGGNSTEGDTISYYWTTFNGSILGGETTTMPEIDASGAYIIWVTNDLNGCVATDTVLIDGATALEDAELAADSILCGNETSLMGNLPFNSSGIWTASNPNDFIENPLTEITQVLDLEAGWHTFFWTLSTPECPDYDMDSLQIYVEGIPDALEDQFDLSGYIVAHEINLLENDDTSPVQNWTLGLVSTPDTGSLTELGAGLFEFSFPEGYFGMQSFEYELCSELCPDQCDTTVVLLNISEPIDTITDISNGITPNGDGVNEEFIIPELKMNPDLYPDNELIIFNRWGDIVYQAKPYLNNWTGTNDGGRELPQGTYYYLLRLDVGEGLIYKGDVTILR